MLITKKLLFIKNYCILRFCLLRFRRFPPIYFVRHENGGSRQNHEFTTCVHEFTACLEQNQSRDHGEHEFTIPMERSISVQVKIDSV